MIKLRRLTALFLTLLLVILPQNAVLADKVKNTTSQNTVSTQNGGPDVEFKSVSSLLMNLDTGEIYQARNIDLKVYPASTTKIMTAILALEHGKLNDTLTVSNTAVKLPSGASGIGLLPGEEVSLNDMMYGLLVSSANDSANVIAEYVAGSIDSFVDMMNAKAKELGAMHTHFANTNGLPDDNHYTTARDMAIMARYAMKNDSFRKFVKTPSYTMNPTNKYKETRVMHSTNKLISSNKGSKYMYSKAIGIKTGFTTPAQHCLIAAADNGSFPLLSVVMGAPLEGTKDYCYEETIGLFKWGFSAFKTQSIAPANKTVSEVKVDLARKKDAVTLCTKEEVKALLPKDANEKEVTVKYKVEKNVKAPVEKGQVLGSASYYYKSNKIATVKLVATESIEQDNLLVTMDKAYNFLSSPLFLVPVCIIVLLFVTFVVVRQVNSRKKRKGFFMTNKRRNYRK